MTSVRPCHRTILPRSTPPRDGEPVLITEAGGRVTDLAGGDVLAGAGDVLTSNGQLHDQLMDLVADLPTGPRPHP